MNKDIKAGLAWAGGLLALSVVGALMRRLGYLDGDTVTRVFVGANGLMIAWYGNRMPKAFVPNACGRQARRVGGWALALSGLVYTALFVFAPIPVALTAGSAVVITGIAVTLGYCLSLRGRAKAV
jgi:hypothetical protein